MRKTGMTRERQSWKAPDGTVYTLQAELLVVHSYPLFAFVYPLVSHLYSPLISVISIRSMCIYRGANQSLQAEYSLTKTSKNK